MKRKYQGFASIMIFIIALGGMACYAVYFTYTLPGSVHISGAVSIPDINLPDKDLIAYIDYIKQHLTDFVLVTENAGLNHNNRYIDLKLFGYKPARGENKEDNLLAETENGFSHVLSLAFFSEKRRFCVIDGKLYPEKALLPQGCKIEKIEHNRVMISKNNRKTWLYLSSALHKLSVKHNKIKTEKKIEIEKKQMTTEKDEKMAEGLTAENSSRAGSKKAESNKITDKSNITDKSKIESEEKAK